jgi:subtilase family serine protease
VREEARNAKPVGTLPQDKVLHFDMMLPLGSPEKLDRFLAEVSDPASSSYRHFVTPKEFTARFGPSQGAWDELVSFARRSGFTVLGGSRDEMDLRLVGTVRAVEGAFQVKMRVFQHPREARTFYSPDVEPTVDMQSVVWHISGLDNFARPQPRVHARSSLAARPLATSGGCPDNSYCGSDMRSAYYGSGALRGAGQSVGLVEFMGYDPVDLEMYFSTTGQTNVVPLNAISTDGSPLLCLYAIGCISPVGSPVSCWLENCDDAEQTLDITQVIGMAPALAQLNIYVGYSDTTILSAMSVVPTGSITGTVDLQLSCSWGWDPVDPAADDVFFKKFAAQGQSFFTAAGDSAAYTPTSDSVFPADDVNVTVVGGSDLSTTGPGGAWRAETAWEDGGGGFLAAGFMPVPTWQTAAIAAFNSRSSTPGSIVWRNSPDVSGEANFDFYVCADQHPSCAQDYGGTSFAAPMWAGYMALVNQQAALLGQPPLGFLNPALYALGNAGGNGYAAAFHDISAGSNGFTAQVGYDLATGWGSPNGAGLIDALVGIAAPGFTLRAGGSVSAAAGGSGTVTLTSAATGGFDSAVTLAARGQPSGVTVTFSPATLTGSGASSVGFNVAATSAVGVYPITLTGTSGGLVESAAFTLTVTAPPPPVFVIAVDAKALSVPHGKSHAYIVQTRASGSIPPAITLSVSGLPPGVTATFSPVTIKGSGSSTVTFKAAASAKRGTMVLTFSGTSGKTKHSSTLNLTVD